jgi:hypothetical protein
MQSMPNMSSDRDIVLILLNGNFVIALGLVQCRPSCIFALIFCSGMASVQSRLISCTRSSSHVFHMLHCLCRIDNMRHEPAVARRISIQDSARGTPAYNDVSVYNRSYRVRNRVVHIVAFDKHGVKGGTPVHKGHYKPQKTNTDALKLPMQASAGACTE